MVTMLYWLIACCFFGIAFAQECSSWAEETLKKLTLQEKIAQLFMIGTTAQEQAHTESLIQKYHVGGVLLVGRNNAAAQIATVNKYQSLSHLPLLIAQDCEWSNMRLEDVFGSPRNLTLGALKDFSSLYKLGYLIGSFCKKVGVHINFAPVADINNNPKNPIIGDRSFGENKEKVAIAATYFTKGLQDAGILACAKHFPGHGDTAVDSHLGLPCINHSKEHFEEIELYPFKALIAQGIKCIMNAHLKVPAWDEIPSSLSKKIVTELLKEKLGFKGIIITDALNMKAITNHFCAGYAELEALLAGNDIILFPVYIEEALKLIEKAVLENKITQSDLDTHVLKILKAKEELLLNKNRLVDSENILQEINSPEAYALKRELYRASLTLVKNDGTLPFTAQMHDKIFTILIEGNQASLFAKALASHAPHSPLYAAPSEQLDSLFTTIKSECSTKEIAVIALFGMNKFAQKGYGISLQTREFIKNLTSLGKKIALILFGSPYGLTFFGSENSILIAYESTEDTQQGVADALFGKLNPQGILPITASEHFKEGIGLTF